MREIRTSGATRGAGELRFLPPTLPFYLFTSSTRLPQFFLTSSGREKKSRFARELGVVGPHLCQLGGAGPCGADSPGIVSAFRCCPLTSFISSS